MPSFFSCLVDCAGFDLVDDCVATPRPGEHIRGSQSSQQARRTPHHTTEALETDASSDSLSLSSDSTIIEGFSGGRRKAAVSPSDCPAPSSWSSSEQAFPEDHVPRPRPRGVTPTGVEGRDSYEGDFEARRGPSAGQGTGEDANEHSGSESNGSSTTSGSRTVSSPARSSSTTGQRTTGSTNTRPITPSQHIPATATATDGGDYSPLRRSALPTLPSIVGSRRDGGRPLGAQPAGTGKTVSETSLSSSRVGVHGEGPQPGSSSKLKENERGDRALSGDELDDWDFDNDDDDAQSRPTATGAATTTSKDAKRIPLRYRSASMETSKSYGGIANNDDDEFDRDDDLAEKYLDYMSNVGGKSTPRTLKRMNSAPSADQVRVAATPGRERKMDGTEEMARRVVAKWGEQDEDSSSSPEKAPRRRQISTSVRNLRLSEDGSTVTVRSERDGTDHRLVLSELEEIQGTPSKNRVVLRGKELELRIAFEGQTQAFTQFRDTLVPIVNSNNIRNDLPPMTPKRTVGSSRGQKVWVPPQLQPVSTGDANDADVPITPKNASIAGARMARSFMNTAKKVSRDSTRAESASSSSEAGPNAASFQSGVQNTTTATLQDAGVSSRAVSSSTFDAPSQSLASAYEPSAVASKEERSSTRAPSGASVNPPTSTKASTLGSRASAPYPASVNVSGDNSSQTKETEDDYDVRDDTHVLRPRFTLSMAQESMGSSTSSLGGVSTISDAMSHASAAFAGNNSRYGLALAGAHHRYQPGGEERLSPTGAAARFDPAPSSEPARVVQVVPTQQRVVAQTLKKGSTAGISRNGSGRASSRVVNRSRQAELPTGNTGGGIGPASSDDDEANPGKTSMASELSGLPKLSTTRVAAEIAKRNALSLGVAKRNASFGGVPASRLPVQIHQLQQEQEYFASGSVSSARQMFESCASAGPVRPVPRRAAAISTSPAISVPPTTGNTSANGPARESESQEAYSSTGGGSQVSRKSGFVAEQRRKLEFNRDGQDSSRETESGEGNGYGYEKENGCYSLRNDSDCDGEVSSATTEHNLRVVGVKAGDETRAAAPSSGHPRNHQTPIGPPNGDSSSVAAASSEITSSGHTRSSYSTPSNRGGDSQRQPDERSLISDNHDKKTNCSDNTMHNKEEHYSNNVVRLADGRAKQSPDRHFVLGSSTSEDVNTRRHVNGSKYQGGETPPVHRARRSSIFREQTPHSSFMEGVERTGGELGGNSGEGVNCTAQEQSPDRPVVLGSRRSDDANDRHLDDGKSHGRTTPPIHTARRSNRLFSKQTPNSSFMEDGVGDLAKGHAGVGRDGAPPMHRAASITPKPWGTQTPQSSFMEEGTGARTSEGTSPRGAGTAGAGTPPVHRARGSKPMCKQTPQSSFMDEGAAEGQ